MAKDLCFQFKHLLLARMPTLAKSNFLCNLSLLLCICYHMACIPMQELSYKLLLISSCLIGASPYLGIFSATSTFVY
ncbi:hypothetical protein P5673_022107 [Acropora cervicornis]|uniref:Uncharacterized protein n=1 Tax=Acropora cervicornis TaxID=6130 RepID=A0AAD9Q7P3_ACRCE|nr:hypothetical protein P5673_022107 [Acropora cervicornis]